MSKKFEYVNTERFSGFASIEVNEVAGIVKIAEANHVKFIFRTGLKDKDAIPEEFFFPVHSTIYSIKSNGFYLLDDYYNACEKKFPNAEEFYEAVKNGYDIYEEYKHSKNAGEGSSNKEDFDNAKTKGFVKHFDTFNRKNDKYKTNTRTLIPPEKMDSPIHICEYAETKGFKNYQEFEKAYDAGYPDMAIFTESTSKGFKSSEDYFDAVTKGFSQPTDYEEAKGKRISSKKELDDYHYLKLTNFKSLAFDEHHLLITLREYENGKKFTLDQLHQLMGKEQLRFKRAFAGSEMQTLPLWYTQNISKIDQFHTFMTANEDIKKNGTYNENAKTYEIFRLSKTKVYVDASNVAYNSSIDKSKTPMFKNIRLVLQELTLRKFTDIVVIADASLAHKAKDRVELQQIRKLAEYHEAPSKTQADIFLIEAIHHNKCIIISNDTFADWQKDDAWVRANINNLRIPFMILDGGRVSIPTIEKIERENNE